MKDYEQTAAIVRDWLDNFAFRSLEAWRRYVKAQGISMPQFGVMMHLYYKGGPEVHSVGDSLDITSAAASQLIDKLAQAGFVERFESSEDRRVRRIELSEKGRAFVQGGLQERYKWAEEVVEGLSEEDMQAVTKALPALMEAERRLRSKDKVGNCPGQYPGH